MLSAVRSTSLTLTALPFRWPLALGRFASYSRGGSSRPPSERKRDFFDEKKVHDFGGERRKRGHVRERERMGLPPREKWDDGAKDERPRERWGGREERPREDKPRERWEGGKDERPKWDGGREERPLEDKPRERWEGGRDERPREERSRERWEGGKDERPKWDGRREETRGRDEAPQRREGEERFNRDRKYEDRAPGRRYDERDRRWEDKGRQMGRRDDRGMRDRRDGGNRQNSEWGDYSNRVPWEKQQKRTATKNKEKEEEEPEERETEEEHEELGDEQGEEELELMKGEQEREMREKREKGGEEAVRDPLEGIEMEEELQLISKHQHDNSEVDPDTTPDYVQSGEVDKGSWEHLDALSRCPGCGCLLQSDEPHKIGYTPHSVVDSRMAQMKDTPAETQETPNSYKEGDEEFAEAEAAKEGELEEGEEGEAAEWKEGAIEAGDEESRKMLEMEELSRESLPDEGGSWSEDFIESYYESPEQEERMLQKDLEKQKLYNVEPEYMAYLESLMGKKKKERPLICQRCYLLKNYNKVVPIRIPVEEFRDRLSRLADINCVVIKVVDLFDFSGTFVHDFRRVIGNNPVILIGNKRDLLPKDIHPKRIIDWMRHEAKERGLQVSQVHLLSSLKGEGLKEFMEELKELRRGRYPSYFQFLFL